MAHYSKFDFFIDLDKLEKGNNKYVAMLEYAFMERIRCKKITVLLLTGDTSEGKSSVSQKLCELFSNIYGINYVDFVDDVTIYTPLEYPTKTKALLFDKRLKKIKFAIIDEGRLVVRAKMWYSFINQAIADVFAMQRKVKRLFIIINTQSLNDIDVDLRRRLTFWGEVYRPLHKKPKVYFHRFWDDTRDPANIKLRKRNFQGLVRENGKIRISKPPYISFGMPSKEVWQKYDINSYKSKASIMKKKLDDLMERMQEEVGVPVQRIEKLFEIYSNPKNREELLMHGRVNKNSEFKLRKEALQIFELSEEQAKEFNEKVTKMFKGEIENQKTFFGGAVEDGVQEKTEGH